MTHSSALSTHNRPEQENFGSEIARAQHELIFGLSQALPRISPKYFYNNLGSKLFEAICQTDEYYLTRAESEIFSTHADDIQTAVGTGCTLIDIGAGNCAKAASLFPVLQPRDYVAVDISVDFLQEAVAGLQAKHPDIPMLAVGSDFSEAFGLPAHVEKQRRVFFYPGSSIGNFTPLEASQCLRRFRAACALDGALLIGVDLVKDPLVLEAAYDDALGITAAFNLNALRHINTLLLADFDVGKWRHCAHYNPVQSRMEMHLEAKQAHRVTWPGGARTFVAGERIHTENSYKFTITGFANMLGQSGFGVTQSWSDAAKSYLVCYAKAL